jgi:DNA-binding NarL/FixJ family response regulator/DNA-binding MarR family transcriptional regulator
LAGPDVPAAPAATGSSRDNAPPEKQFGQEDSPAILTLVRAVPNHPPLHHILTGAGYYVWRATTAAEALAAGLREQNVGILLCDLMLPSGPGVEFLATLRGKLPPHRALVGIFMAEAASINDVITTMRAGAVDFIGRGIAPDHLLEAIRRAERIVQQQRMSRMLAHEVGRLGHSAIALGQQLTAEIEAARGGGTLDGAAAFAERLPLEVSAASVHARSLLNRRHGQVTIALRAQIIRQRAFGELASNSAAWAMLLDLYDKTLRNQSISVSSLCLASGAPTSTALRRLDELVEGGLILREKDTVDARRTLVSLTDEARDRMNAYLDAMA